MPGKRNDSIALLVDAPSVEKENCAKKSRASNSNYFCKRYIRFGNFFLHNFMFMAHFRAERKSGERSIIAEV